MSNTKNNQLSRLESFYNTPKALIHKRTSFDLVPKVRENVLKIYESDKSVLDECDVNRIQTDDWSVQRFVEYYDNNAEEATDKLVSTLKWRKSYGVNTRSLDTDIGKEFHNIGALFVYNEDKNGIPVIFMRSKGYRKIAKLQPIIEMFFVSLIEQLDIRSANKGYVLVIDSTDAGISNLSMDLLNFVITTLRVHYPLGIQYVIVYNMPLIMRGVWKLVKGWLGIYKQLVKFANGDEIQNYISIESLPKCCGGKCEQDFTKAPDNCPTVYDLAERYGFTQSEVKKMMKVYEDLLEEAKQYELK